MKRWNSHTPRERHISRHENAFCSSRNSHLESQAQEQKSRRNNGLPTHFHHLLHYPFPASHPSNRCLWLPSHPHPHHSPQMWLLRPWDRSQQRAPPPHASPPTATSSPPSRPPPLSPSPSFPTSPSPTPSTKPCAASMA